VLVHAFPNADIPVLQLSINALEPFAYHFELGRRLAFLRDRGILIVASGNVVHNLGLIAWAKGEMAFDWNHRFDGAVKAVLSTHPAEFIGLQNHPDFALAASTPEHFIPVLYFAGLAAEAKTAAEPLVEGFAMGSLSMASYALGYHGNVQTFDDFRTAGLGRAPADQSNA
jgi:4,5-DOPA dioxygenase extradiol